MLRESAEIQLLHQVILAVEETDLSIFHPLQKPVVTATTEFVLASEMNSDSTKSGALTMVIPKPRHPVTVSITLQLAT
jgi:hypothetical protein